MKQNYYCDWTYIFNIKKNIYFNVLLEIGTCSILPARIGIICIVTI